MNDDPFVFTEGDTVLVRVREHGATGRLVAKFVTECTGFRASAVQTHQACFDLPFGPLNTVKLAPHEAEFEQVESVDEVNF